MSERIKIEDGETCPCCEKPLRLSPAIVVLVIHAPMLAEPYPLIPADNYRVCMNEGCDSIPNMIGLAIRAHPKTRDHADFWTDAIFVWADPSVLSLRARMHRGGSTGSKMVLA